MVRACFVLLRSRHNQAVDGLTHQCRPAFQKGDVAVPRRGSPDSRGVSGRTLSLSFGSRIDSVDLALDLTLSFASICAPAALWSEKAAAGSALPMFVQPLSCSELAIDCGRVGIRAGYRECKRVRRTVRGSVVLLSSSSMTPLIKGAARRNMRNAGKQSRLYINHQQLNSSKYISSPIFPVEDLSRYVR